MLNKKQWQWPVAFVCLCLGFLIAIQMQTQSVLSRPTLPSQRLEAAMDMLQETQREKDALEAEIDSLRAAVGRQADERASLSAITEQLKRAQIQAGLTSVTGPGVLITMRDSDRPSRPEEDPELFLIHDSDILSVVNELRASGAEAIAINGQRVVSSTAIRCVGPVILINTKLTAPPFKIEAIGDPNNLMEGLSMRSGVIYILRSMGIGVDIVTKDSLTLPAYTGSMGGSYAQIATDGGS